MFQPHETVTPYHTYCIFASHLHCYLVCAVQRISFVTDVSCLYRTTGRLGVSGSPEAKGGYFLRALLEYRRKKLQPESWSVRRSRVIESVNACRAQLESGRMSKEHRFKTDVQEQTGDEEKKGGRGGTSSHVRY